MKISLAKLNKQTPRFIALALCLWLSGTVCAVSCGAMTQRQTAQIETTEQQPSCPMHRQSSGSEENNSTKNKSAVAAQINAPVTACCPFISLQGETARKIKQTNAPVLTATIANVAFLLKTPRETVFRSTYRTIPRTRGDTYLRNCVFLI